MRDNFEHCLSLVLHHEGGFVNHPKDPGGMTNMGVTKKVYEKYMEREVTEQEMRDMPGEHVQDIYKRKYWDKVKGDDLPSGVDWCIFDFAVNAGPSRAAKTVQQFVGAGIDGVIGPNTIKKIEAYPAGIKGVIETYTAQRSQFYRNLKTYATFGKGWDRRTYETRKQAIDLLT
tara:strand:+ start:544 stop:1062 length:519 start_codon:yes stop_codon:yes gene_type:complete